MFSAILAYIWTCYKGVVDKSAPCLYQCFSDSSGVINWTSKFLRLDKHSMVSYMPGRARESPLSVDFWVGKWLVIQFFWILSRKVFWLRPFHAIPLACRVGCPRPSVTLSAPRPGPWKQPQQPLQDPVFPLLLHTAAALVSFWDISQRGHRPPLPARAEAGPSCSGQRPLTARGSWAPTVRPVSVEMCHRYKTMPYLKRLMYD